MSTPTLPFSTTDSELFSIDYSNEDPENIYHEELTLSVKSNSMMHQNFTTVHNEDESDEEI
jgi:hypothetical protein